MPQYHYSIDPSHRMFKFSYSIPSISEAIKEIYTNILPHKDQVCLGSNMALKSQVMQHLHNSPIGGHLISWLCKGSNLSFIGKENVIIFDDSSKSMMNVNCNKTENVELAGLLQPLPIPSTVWTEISMNFIEGLSLSHGQNMIMVVDERLSKYAYFVSLSDPYTVVTVGKLSWTTYSNRMACLPP